MSDVVDGRAGLLCLAAALALAGCQAGGKVETATRGAPAGSEAGLVAQNRSEAKDGEIKMAYVATRTFQILPPRPTLLDESWGLVEKPADREEQAQFMRLQQAVVLSDEVIDSVLKIASVRQTPWFQENYQNPAAQLRKCLRVIPDPAAGLLRITVSGERRADAAALVDAVADEYRSALEENEARANSERRQALGNAVTQLQTQADMAQEEMKAYRINNKVQAIVPAGENADLAERRKQAADAGMEFAAAQSAVNGIRQQIAASTLELTGAQQDALEKDALLQTIETLRIQTKTERDVEIKKNGEDKPSDLQARLDSLRLQAKDRREALASDMKRRVQEETATRFIAAQALYAFAQQQVREDGVGLQDMDRKLVQYAAMQHDYDQLIRTLDELKRRKVLLDLSSREDMMRVRPVGASAQVPTEQQEIER